MKHVLLLAIAAAFVLAACGKSDTPKSPTPTIEKKDAMKK